MILPDNGSVVIIDDTPSEVEALMSALTRERMPFLFFKDQGGEDLPPPGSPIENIRLVFLDFDLGVVSDNSVIGKIRVVQQRLERIIAKNIPYVLVIWSKDESRSDYKEELEHGFDTHFSSYKPIHICSIDKKTILGISDHQVVLKTIRAELFSQLGKFQSFNAFLLWESIVNQSAGQLINDLVVKYPSSDHWNVATQHLLYKLALAYSGKLVSGHSNIKQLKSALFALSNSVHNIIEDRITTSIGIRLDGLNLVKDNGLVSDDLDFLINSQLLLSKSFESGEPGTVICTRDLLVSVKTIQAKHRNKVKMVKKFHPKEKHQNLLEATEKSNRKDIQEAEKAIVDHNARYNDIAFSGMTEKAQKIKARKSAVLKKKIDIMLNVTPICDYAQDKAPMSRMLPGLMIPESERASFNTQPAYVYISDATVNWKNDNFFFLFDFRYLHSISKKESGSLIPTVKFKYELLADIQIKLSSHVNRAGVIYLPRTIAK